MARTLPGAACLRRSLARPTRLGRPGWRCAPLRPRWAARRPCARPGRSRCGRGGGAAVALRDHQHVLAQRRQVPAAQRAAVGGRLAVLGPADLPPARVGAPCAIGTRMPPSAWTARYIRRRGASRPAHPGRDRPAPDHRHPAPAAGRLSQPPDRLPERLRAGLPRPDRRGDHRSLDGASQRGRSSPWRSATSCW